MSDVPIPPYAEGDRRSNQPYVQQVDFDKRMSVQDGNIAAVKSDVDLLKAAMFAPKPAKPGGPVGVMVVMEMLYQHLHVMCTWAKWIKRLAGWLAAVVGGITAVLGLAHAAGWL